MFRRLPFLFIFFPQTLWSWDRLSKEACAPVHILVKNDINGMLVPVITLYLNFEVYRVLWAVWYSVLWVNVLFYFAHIFQVTQCAITLCV